MPSFARPRPVGPSRPRPNSRPHRHETLKHRCFGSAAMASLSAWLNPGLLGLLTLAAGCVTPAPAGDGTELQVTPVWHVTNSTAIDHCDNSVGFCWESSVAALPNGTLVASDGFAQSIARSLDGGHTWKRIRGPGQPQAQLSDVPGWSDTDSLVTATPDGHLVFSAIAATYHDAPQ